MLLCSTLPHLLHPTPHINSITVHCLLHFVLRSCVDGWTLGVFMDLFALPAILFNNRIEALSNLVLLLFSLIIPFLMLLMYGSNMIELYYVILSNEKCV